MTRFKLDKPPLIFVLAQVVMSDVLKIEKAVPDIQEDLRKHGFPLLEERVVNQVTFSLNEPPNIDQRKIWWFLASDKKQAVVLSRNAVVLQMSAYESFGGFSQTLSRVVITVQNATKVELVLRLGLRYVNRISALEGEDLRVLLDEHLLGLPDDDLPKDQRNLSRRCEQDDQTSMGILRMRVTQSTRESSLEQELGPIPVEVPGAELQSGAPTALLDLDHFSLEQFPFNPEEIMQRIHGLHKDLEQRFVRVVTEDALQRWGHREKNVKEGV